MKRGGTAKSVATAFSKLSVAPPLQKSSARTPRPTNPYDVLDVTRIAGDGVASPSDGPCHVQAYSRAAPQISYGIDSKPANDGDWNTINRYKQLLSQGHLGEPEAMNDKEIYLTALSHETDRDWRNRDPETQLRRRASQKKRSTIARLAGKSVKGSYAPGPRTLRGVPFFSQVEGAIVWHWHQYPKLGNKPCAKNEIEVVDRHGKTWLKKGRYWIIVKSQDEQVWEVPIFTFNDTGLQKKSRAEGAHYLSVRPPNVRPSDFQNQSLDNPVLVIDDMDHAGEGRGMSTCARLTMVAHYTNVQTRNVDDPDLRLIGHLDKESIDTVCGMARRYVRK